MDKPQRLFQQLVMEAVKQDLRAFVDPGTEIECVASGLSFSVTWEMRTEPHTAVITPDFEHFAVVHYREARLHYRSFLAQPALADLQYLAKMIRRAPISPIFVDTRAESEGFAPASARTLVRQHLESHDPTTGTNILMVTADAGAGKTSVLRQLVVEQADQYLSGQSQHLYFFVNAQGRALSRLEEAFAYELDSLNYPRPYHVIEVLTRRGLLIPIIDGFDELLGVSGYDESFGSLARFVDALDGRGALVTSARSTFYEQEFASRAQSRAPTEGAWSIRELRVLQWQDAEQDQYISRALELTIPPSTLTRSEVRAKLTEMFGTHARDVVAKPFFFSKAIELVLSDARIEAGSDALEVLARSYMARENAKLLGKDQRPLVTVPQYEQLLTDIAEEMWNLEAAEITVSVLKDVVDFSLAVDEVDEGRRRYLVERLPVTAFLKRGATQRTLAFEHESFFAYFLGRRVWERMEGTDTVLRTLLGRSALPEDVTQRAIALMVSAHDPTALARTSRKLSSVSSSEGVRATMVRENSGRLLAGALRATRTYGDALASAVAKDVIFNGVSLRGARARLALSRCTFRNADLTDCILEVASIDRETTFLQTLVDVETTRIRFFGAEAREHFNGLRAVGPGSQDKTVFAPEDVSSILVSIGAMTAESQDARRWDRDFTDLLERIGRHYRKSNLLSPDTDDQRTAAIARHPHWEAVQKLLLDAGVATMEVRQTSGSPRRFLRIAVKVDDLLAGAGTNPPLSNEATRRFWEAAAKDFCKV